MYPYKSGSEERTGLTTCEEKNVEFVKGNGFSYSQFLFLKDVKLTLEEEKCEKWLGGVSCNVNIGPENKLKWSGAKKDKVAYQPKVTYQAF